MALSKSQQRNAARNQKYWSEREKEALKHYIRQEEQYDREIKRIYTAQLDAIQKEIDSFYGKYAKAEGITIAEAKKRVSQHDVKAFQRKAAKYVKDKDFSKKANEELRLYNLTMKVNRLEMLKANIGLEMIAGHDELDKFMGKILKGRTEDELKRQAGILGETIRNNAKLAHTIPNASFHHATFSDRIWQYQDMMKADLSKLLQSALIQGKNPRAVASELRKYLLGDKHGKGARYNMERLMRTELARVQTEAQKQSFKQNGFGKYLFIANGGCCPICAALNGKHFDISKMMPGENAPPVHPHCRCSTAAYEDSKEYEAWLDYLASGGTTEEWEKGGGLKNRKAKTPKKESSGTVSTTNDAAMLDLKNFPDSFTKGAEKRNTAKFVEYVNGLKGANPDTIKLYNSMRKLENIETKGIPFKISHGKNHAVGRRTYYDGRLHSASLCIPKLSGAKLAGQINTILHENMHLIDMYCRKDAAKGGGWFSSSRTKFTDMFARRSSDMSDEVKDLFGRFKTEYNTTRNAVSSDYKKKRAELWESYFPNGASIWEDIDKYRAYEKEAKKLDKWYKEELDYQCRNIMGGGVTALQDIYDALSGGTFRDNGTVIYGHGSSYYHSQGARAEETLANYGALSVAHPELVEMLRKDKPELVAELEAMVKEMAEKEGETP